MENKNIIIRLILADLKHNQLISALEGIHLLTDGLYFINLSDAVAQLMGIEGGKSELWFSLYDSYMEQGALYNVEGRAENLLPLTEECYHHLRTCITIEERIREKQS